jgi:hypothetical protein
MSVLLAIVLTVAAMAVAVALLLLIRRRAPDGGFFNDGDRAAGFFGVLATGFAITVGFVVFLAFESFDQSRAGAETEAVIVAQQLETAQLLLPRVRPALDGALVCYARYVVGREWPQMEAGHAEEAPNPWGVALFRAIRVANPRSASEQAAFSKWLDQTSDREQARQDRIHGAEGVIPTPLWIVLFFGAAAIFVFMLFFADSGERAVVQGLMIGSVVGVLCLTLAVIGFLNEPFQTGTGGLRPTAMERTLRLLDTQLRIVGVRVAMPCDARGVATER